MWETGGSKGQTLLATGTSCLCARGRRPLVPQLLGLRDPQASPWVQLPLAAGRAGARRPALPPSHVQASPPGFLIPL